VKKGKFEFDGEEWDYISKDAKNLINAMLVIDPTKRINAEQILSHPWFLSEMNESSSSQIQKVNNNKKFIKN